MQFLYFIHGAGGSGTIKNAGLENILDNPVRICSRLIYEGPDGQRGMMYSFCEPKDCNYKPNEQSWRKSNCGKYHIGFYKDSPPTEKELAREVRITGHKIKLRTEEEWIIPLARIFPAGTRLPQSLILGANGEVVTEILPQFVRFSQKAEKLWKDFEIQIGLAEGRQEMTDAEGIIIAAEALGFNYRINIDGINALGFFTTQNFLEILYAIIDAGTVFDRLKTFVADNEKKNSLTDSPQQENSGQMVN